MHQLTKFLSRWKVWEQVQALTVFLSELKELLYALSLSVSVSVSVSVSLSLSLSLSLSQPQWGAATAEIKVPSDENTELKGSPLKA